jgi:hypothetical protein
MVMAGSTGEGAMPFDQRRRMADFGGRAVE